MNTTLQSRISGILVGTAVGDSIGLPTEGLKPQRIKKLNWIKNSERIKHHFFFGRGMWSDDTEHTIMLTQALLASGGDLEKFQRAFCWVLRWWLLAFPAGVGMATAKSILKLWLGFSTKRSGVFSAGNGPAMRTAIIAAYFPDDRQKRQEFTIAHTIISHQDPKASIGALAVTEITALLLNKTKATATDVFKILDSLTEVSFQGKRGEQQAKEDWLTIVRCMSDALENKLPAHVLLKEIGGQSERGVSGYG